MNIRGSLLNNFLFPEMVTHIPESDKIYLTFDDGPTPGVTNQVLAFLHQYQAKATFFCKGENVESQRDIFQEIGNCGHVTGNHGYSHLHGWYTRNAQYINDCKKAAELIPNPIFRPPFGKLSMGQYKSLKENFTIYLWSALSWDFHPMVSPDICFKIAAKNLKPGTIIVFHDTRKASEKLMFALPRILELGLRKGYSFATLPI